MAHVYVKDAERLEEVRGLLAATPGVDEVLDRAGQAAYGLDHERSGELVLVADPRAWFTYYYWLDDDHAPDFARGVEIHRKPGYDPAELFFDPADRSAKARAGLSLVRKKLGLRYAMSSSRSTRAGCGAATAACPTTRPTVPSLLSSDAGLQRETVAAADVRDLVLEAAGAPVAATVHH